MRCSTRILRPQGRAGLWAGLVGVEEEVFEGQAADLPEFAGFVVDDESALAFGSELEGDFEHLIAFAAANENAVVG